MKTLVLTDGKKFLRHQFTTGYTLVDTEVEASHYTAASKATKALAEARHLIPGWLDADITTMTIRSAPGKPKAPAKPKREPGRSKIRKDGHVGISVFFDAATHQRLCDEAERQGKSLAAFIRESVTLHLDRLETDCLDEDWFEEDTWEEEDAAWDQEDAAWNEAWSGPADDDEIKETPVDPE